MGKFTKMGKFTSCLKNGVGLYRTEDKSLIIIVKRTIISHFFNFFCFSFFIKLSIPEKNDFVIYSSLLNSTS